MNALALLAPLPLALLLGSAALPPSGVQVVNRSGAGVQNVRVCRAGECWTKDRLASGERWLVTSEAGQAPVRLTVDGAMASEQVTTQQRGRGVQLVLERDSRAAAGRQ